MEELDPKTEPASAPDQTGIDAAGASGADLPAVTADDSGEAPAQTRSPEALESPTEEPVTGQLKATELDDAVSAPEVAPEEPAVAAEDTGAEAGAEGPAAEAAIEQSGEPLEPLTAGLSDEQLQAVLEAVVYVAEEPLTLAQISNGLAQPVDRIQAALRHLIEEFERSGHGIGIREVAGGYKMATKAEHHDAVRSFVKSLKPPLKLSLPALETLAVIAYKQPVTSPEIMEIRGVQGTGVLKTLLDRKLIATAGRKAVLGKPMLYKTTKEFLIQFGLKDINELPSLKEFEEIRRMAFADADMAAEPEAPFTTEAVSSEAPPVESIEPQASSEPEASREAAPEPAAEAPSAEPETVASSEAAVSEAEIAQEAAAATEAAHEAEPES